MGNERSSARLKRSSGDSESNDRLAGIGYEIGAGGARKTKSTTNPWELGMARRQSWAGDVGGDKIRKLVGERAVG